MDQNEFLGFHSPAELPWERTIDDSSALPRRRRNWWLAAVKVLIVAVLVWGVHGSIQKAFAQLAQQSWQPRDLRFSWLLAAAGAYLLGMLPSGLFWYGVMRRLGARPGLVASLRAYYIGHLGKYVPGKAMVVVLRAGLVQGSATKARVAAAAVFCETLTTMSVGGFLAGGILALWYRHQTTALLLAVAVMAVSGLPTLPPVFRRLARLAGVVKGDADTAASLDQLGYGALARGWVGITVGWVAIGWSLAFTLKGLGATTQVALLADLPLCLAAAALSVVVGFLSLVPGGIVVREAILLQLLAETFSEGPAMVAAVLLRLVWLLAELSISVILYLARPAPPRTPEPNPA